MTESGDKNGGHESTDMIDPALARLDRQPLVPHARPAVPETPDPSRLRRIGRWLLWVLLAFLLTSIMLTLPLRWLDPPTTSFMLRDSSGRDPVLYQWVDWNEMSESLAIAVVAAEDQRFDKHHGIDFESIQDSIDDARHGDRLRGASTITQQLVKNLYLWPGQSFVRKGIEAWLTLNLELFLPKRRILEIYLNIVELGPGIYGASAASQAFFNKPASAVTNREAALLAAVLPSPRRFKVDAPSDYVAGRQSWILGQMARLRREHWLTTIL